MLQIRLLGQFDVRLDGKRVMISSRAGQSLLAYLALTAGTAHRREKLAGTIWPDITDETARKNLRQELWRIRKAISAGQPAENEYLLADEYTLKFNRDAQYWLDVAQMERPDLDLQSLIANLSLYQGELLPGFYDEWITLERERIQSVFDARMEQLLEGLTTADRWVAVQEWGERWLTFSGVREPAYRALMLASGARGDMAKVASLYQRCTDELREQLGVEPSAETRALHDGLLKGTKAPRASAQPSGTITFLFTDIEGSTRLLEKLGDRYAIALTEHHEILRAAIQRWNGHEVDTQGDAFFVTFTRALDAVQCAAEAQRALQSHAWHEGETLRVRMGLHTGEPLIGSTGYVGMDVHRAARIGDAGHGGQILLSQTTRELVVQDLPEGMTIRDLGEFRLKDMKFPTPIYQLVVDGLPADFAPIRTKFTGAEAPTPGEAPFKGLEYFDVDDSDLFFGREILTEKLVHRLRGLPSPEGEGSGVRFLSVIIGASGSGKSSLVRAGLVPAIRKGNVDWRVHILTPTAHPLEALAIELTRDSESVTAAATLVDDFSKDPRSLHFFLSRQHQTRDSSHTLLVIDQFEELFTLCRDNFEREAFIDNLLTALSPSPLTPLPSGEGDFTLILTLRADFYTHLAQYPELRDAVAQQQEYIGPMTSEELRRAIEEPAKRGHWEFEPGLVDLILRDVGDEPGALPLLSHALLETWKRRAGHVLTLKGYADAGGVRGAIAHTAESVFQSLSPSERTIMRNILLRLTEFGEGTEDTRRRASFDELMSSAENAEDAGLVLNKLAEARLVTLSEDQAEVAHEALIREWPQLREWLSQDREGIILHRHLTEAAQEWELLERDAGSVYRGARLAQANEWSALNQNVLNAQERLFLEALNNQMRREEQEREEQRQRELVAARELAETQRQSASRLRIHNRVITTVGSVAIILALLAGMFGFQSNQNAETAAQNAQVALQAQATAQSNAEVADQAKAEAEAQQRIAIARELAASADNTLSIDPELSILLALQGVEATSKDGFALPEVENALHRAIANSRIEKTFHSNDEGTWDIEYSPDGTRFVTAGQDGNVHFWDANTYEKIFTIKAHDDGGANSVAFSPDGKSIVTVGDDSLIQIWDTSTQDLLATLEGHTDWVIAVAYRPNGEQLATIAGDSTFRIWSVSTGKQLAIWQLDDFVPYLRSLAYSPDGTKIMFINGGIFQIRDADTGDIIHSLPVSPNDFTFALSSDQARLAVIVPDQTYIQMLDASNNQVLYNIPYPSNHIERISFSPDNSLLAAVGRDRKVHIWDASNGLEVHTLAGHNEFIYNLAFSPDGKHLVSAGIDGAVKIWSLEPSREVLTIPNVTTNRFALSPDGTRVATNGALNPLTGRADLFQIWDLQIGNLIFEEVAYESRGMAVTYSPDGTEIATGGSDLTLNIRDALSGKLIHTLPVEDATIYGIAYRPDGKIFAAVGTSGMIQLFDRVTGKPLQSWDAGLGGLSNVVFSPDGSRLAVVSPVKNETKVYDANTGEELLLLEGHTNNNWGIDYNSDGTRLVTAGRDATARIWDANTGELLRTLTGHTSTIGHVHFSPDDTKIITGGADGLVIIWDATTGESLLEIEGYNASVDFTPDGKRAIVIGDNRNTLKVVALTIDELVQIAKSRLTRTWTLEECQKYLHVEVCPSGP